MQMLVKILDNQTINKRKINNKNNKKEKGNYIINFFGESKNVKSKADVNTFALILDAIKELSRR